MAIRYATPPPVRNADTVARLRDIAEGPAFEPATVIERSAARIATEMMRIHGGNWEYRIDHQRKMMMVWATD